jgi:hypothetical protein
MTSEERTSEKEDTAMTENSDELHMTDEKANVLALHALKAVLTGNDTQKNAIADVVTMCAVGCENCSRRLFLTMLGLSYYFAVHGRDGCGQYDDHAELERLALVEVEIMLDRQPERLPDPAPPETAHATKPNVTALRLVLSSLEGNTENFTYTLSDGMHCKDCAAELIKSMADFGAVFAIRGFDGLVSPVATQARKAVETMLLDLLDEQATS